MQHLERGSAVDLAISVIGTVAVVAITALGVFVILDILSRLLLFPLRGTMELCGLFLAIGVFLAFGYAQRAGMHVRVTTLISRLPLRWQAILDIFVDLLIMALFALVLWKIGEVGYHYWQSQTWYHATLPLPMWIENFVAAVGFACCFLVSLIELLSRVSGLIARKNYRGSGT